MSDSSTAATQETAPTRSRGSGGHSGFVFPTWTVGRVDSTNDEVTHRSQHDTAVQYPDGRNLPSLRQQGDWQSRLSEKPDGGKQGHHGDGHSRGAPDRQELHDNRSHYTESPMHNHTQEVQCNAGGPRAGRGRYSGDSEQGSAIDRASVTAEQQPAPQLQQQQQQQQPQAQKQPHPTGPAAAGGRQYSPSPQQTPPQPSQTAQQTQQQTQHNVYPQQTQPVQQQSQDSQTPQGVQLGPNMAPYQQTIQPSLMQPQAGMQKTPMMPTPQMMSPTFAGKPHMMPSPLGYQPRRQGRQQAGFNLSSSVPDFDDPVTDDDLFALPPPNFSNADGEWASGVEDSGWRPRRPSPKWEAEGMDSSDWPDPMLQFPGMMGDDRLRSKRSSNWGLMPRQPRSWGAITTAPPRNLLSLDYPDFDGGDSFNFGNSFMATGVGRTDFDMDGLDAPNSVACRPFIWGDGVSGVGSGGRGGGSRRNSFGSGPAWFPTEMSNFRRGQYDFM